MSQLYKSYVFRDKDPIIYELWELLKHIPFARIAADSGVAAATLRNWFYGPTCRPQAATVRAVLRSQGFDIGVVKGIKALPEPVRMSPPKTVLKREGDAPLWQKNRDRRRRKAA